MVRALQISLIVAGTIPLILGIMNFLGGAEAPWIPDGAATPSMDNQLRFYAIWFILPFPLAIWLARNLRQAMPIAQILFGTMFLAGLARLYSITEVGYPEPAMIGAMAVEIIFVLFIPWIAFVQRRMDRTGVAP